MRWRRCLALRFPIAGQRSLDCVGASSETKRSARYINNRGLASYHMQEYDEAIADFTLAIEIDSATASIFFNRGNAHFAKGEHPLALQVRASCNVPGPCQFRVLEFRVVGLWARGIRALGV